MEYSQAGNGCQPHAHAAVDGWPERIRGFLWPSTCLLCCRPGQPDLDLCAPCEADLPLNAFACSQCAEPLSGDAAVAVICGRCLRRPPGFQTSCVPYRYGYPIDRLVQGLKYRREIACGRVLGRLFAKRMLAVRNGPMPQLIIPVPLAPRRYRQRGYNQAGELALPIGKMTGISVRNDLVMRTRETQEQTALDQKARRKNLRRAFEIAAKLPAPHVAILDDVVTTGSTVDELAKVLRRAGAKRIEVWAVARAGRT